MKFAGTFMVSALSGDGVDDLRHILAAMVPAGPPPMITNRTAIEPRLLPAEPVEAQVTCP